MSKSPVTRAALTVALLAISACSQAPRDVDPRLSQPLPPPSQVSSGAPLSSGAVPGPQDIVLRGAAFAVSGDGRYPQNSRLTVRVYDAAVGNVNEWVAEQSYTRSGGLPWPYEMRFRTEALKGVTNPALAARIEGPDGRLVYETPRAIPLVEGGSEDIPLSPVAGGGVAALPDGESDQYIDSPIAQQPQQSYGIPDIRSSYGSPRYDAPVYLGQSYEPTSISGPPSNTIF